MKLNNAKCRQKNICILTLETAYSCVLRPQSNPFAHADQTQAKCKDYLLLSWWHFLHAFHNHQDLWLASESFLGLEISQHELSWAKTFHFDRFEIVLFFNG